MKKTIAILLVAILAVSSVFAAFSGSAQVGVGANFDNNQYGFIGNSTKVNFNFDLATASAEAVGEGDVYASIKGSLGLVIMTDEDSISAFDESPATILFANIDPDATAPGSAGIGLYARIDEAKVAGENWYVSLLGVPGGPDFAESAIDTWTVEDDTNDYGILIADYDDAATWSLPYVKAPGVEVGIYDFVVGAGFKAEAGDDPELDLFKNYGATLYAATPEFDINGLTFQVAAAWSATNYSGTDKAYTNKNDGKAYNAAGASVKFGFANDTLSASIASDLGYDFEAEEFGADVAANFTFANMVIVDGYYATDAEVDGTATENLLSAKVTFDANAFNAPVKVTVTGKDLVNKQDLDASVEVGLGAFTLTPSVGYVIDTEKFNAGVKVAYEHEYFTLAAETAIETGFEDDDLVWSASASIENSTLIPGATIKLAWSDADDLLNNDAASDTHYGKIVASMKLAF